MLLRSLPGRAPSEPTGIGRTIDCAGRTDVTTDVDAMYHKRDYRPLRDRRAITRPPATGCGDDA
jgi:hypothetical protein